MDMKIKHATTPVITVLIICSILFYLVLTVATWNSAQKSSHQAYEVDPASLTYPDPLNKVFDSFNQPDDLSSSKTITTGSCEKLPPVNISDDFLVPNSFTNITPITYPFDIEFALKPITKYIPPAGVASFGILLIILIWKTFDKRVLKQPYSNRFEIPTLLTIFVTSNILIVNTLILGGLIFFHDYIIKHKNFNDYDPYIEFVRNMGKTLSGIGWLNNPAFDVDKSLIVNGIIDETSNKNIYAAAKYADLLLEEYELQKLRENIYLHAAKAAFNEVGLESSLYFSKKALVLNDNRINKTLVEHIKTLYAYQIALKGNYPVALNLLVEQEHWDPKNLYAIWVSILLNQLQFSGILSEGVFVKSKIPQAYSILQTYLGYAYRTDNIDLQNNIRCLYIPAMKLFAQEAFNNGKKEYAANLVELALTHIPEDQEANNFLGTVYHSIGVDSFNDENTEIAISYLDKALKRLPKDKGLQCHLSTSLMSLAMDHAYLEKFDLAEKNYQRAKELCAIKGMNERIGEIDIMHGKWHMKNGQYNHARLVFSRLHNSDSPKLIELAVQLKIDSRNAPNRYQVLKEAIKWAEIDTDLSMPRISGSLCAHFDEFSRKCTTVHFFNGIKLIGFADPKMRHVEIEDKHQVIIFKDGLKNGRIDTVEFSEHSKRRRIVEVDGDYRLDAEMAFDTRGNLIQYKKYSGRVLIKIPSGVIGNIGPDWFGSEPDAYLVFKHNDYYLGHTKTAEDQRFPSWNDAFVIDYKKGDRVVISMWDDDSGLFKSLGVDEDDFIDNFLIRSYPESKVLVGLNKKAAIEVRATPTRLPPGAYEVSNSEYVNIFQHGNFDELDKGTEVHSIIDQARKAKKTSKRVTELLTWTIPELAVYTTMAEARIIYQIAASILGSEILESQIKSKDDE